MTAWCGVHFYLVFLSRRFVEHGRSVGSDGEPPSAVDLKFSCRFSIGFMSGLWLDLLAGPVALEQVLCSDSL